MRSRFLSKMIPSTLTELSAKSAEALSQSAPPWATTILDLAGGTSRPGTAVLRSRINAQVTFADVFAPAADLSLEENDGSQAQEDRARFLRFQASLRAELPEAQDRMRFRWGSFDDLTARYVRQFDSLLFTVPAEAGQEIELRARQFLDWYQKLGAELGPETPEAYWSFWSVHGGLNILQLLAASGLHTSLVHEFSLTESEDSLSPVRQSNTQTGWGAVCRISPVCPESLSPLWQIPRAHAPSAADLALAQF